MASTVNLEVPRNGHCYKIFQYLDDDGLPADLTGATLSAKAQSPAGDGTIIATATVAVVIPEIGQFSIKWTGADFDSYGELSGLVVVSYDLKIERADGIIDVPMRGNLSIIPECTP